ncbi:MAG: lysophospholipase [Bdellovibrionales bacterium]|nr:lysophospholipase [Bdellovibrionales bacterium]
MTTAAGFERNYYGVKQPQGFPGMPEGWFTEWETRVASDDATKLFALVHRKRDVAVKRVLVLVHGFGEHAGRYLHFPHYLDACGSGVDAVFAYDQRGHGRSEGLRGDVDRFDSLADDLEGMLRHVETKFPGAEIHLLGHSLGGHVALRFGFLHPGLPLKSFQVSAPYLALHKEPPLPLRGVAAVLSKTWKTLSLSTDVDASVLSRDDRVVENYSSDRLNHGRMTPRFYASMTAAQKDTLARREGFGYPGLAVHVPLADRLVNTPVTLAFFERLDLPGKRLFEYPDFRHEPMNEIGKEAFFENLSAVVSGAAPGGRS